MAIDIVHDLKAVKVESSCTPVEREICHVIRGDLDCRPVRSAPRSCDGTATQNQAKRFADDAREVVRVGRQ